MVKIRLFSLILLSFVLSNSFAQTSEVDPQIEAVGSLVHFFEYMLNTVGSESSTQRDKDVIITQSFTKAFASDKVQIEDDLLDDRKVVTNKDIRSYLKDVDFFFKNISFHFGELKISKEEKPNGEPYYLVSFENTLEGVSIEGVPVKKIQKRFLEVNFNNDQKDLKIVSVYTTKISREKELYAWWESLSFGWKEEFTKSVPFKVLTSEVLFRIADLDSLDISGNQLLTDLDPLLAVRNLRYLNISNTRIKELNSARYSSGLQTIKANNTPLNDISALNYFDQISHLELSHSAIQDIAPVQNLKHVRYLDISSTAVLDFTPLTSLSALEYLNLSNTFLSDPKRLAENQKLVELNVSRTQIRDVNGLGKLAQLQLLDISKTAVSRVNELAQLPSLKVLNIDQTSVASLEALSQIRTLSKIYADDTPIEPAASARFMKQYPRVLVVTSSEETKLWWDGLSASWKTTFSAITGGPNPTKESLIKLINMDSLNLNQKQLTNGEPLKKFERLRYLNISGNQFTDFQFTKNMEELEILVANRLPVTSASGLESNLNLIYLSLNCPSLQDIQPIYGLSKLQLLDVEGTSLGRESIIQFIQTHPETLVLFQYEELKQWWDSLNTTWQAAFEIKQPNTGELHALVQKEALQIKGHSIADLKPLEVFVNLKEIKLDNTRVLNFIGLERHKRVKVLHCTNGPFQTIDGIQNLIELEELNLNNTAIEDLRNIGKAKSIKRLNCSGTNVKNLRGIDNLLQLELLDVSNTGVFNLDRVPMKIKKLVCYNTRLRDYEVQKFKTQFPECEVVYY